MELFSIFGGVEWGDIESSKPAIELIEELVLNDYSFIRNDVSELTGGSPTYHAILTAIALGDGKTTSSFKRANVPKEVGDKAVEELCSLGIITLVKSQKVFTSWENDHPVANRLVFTSPFLKFWFAFVSPLFKGIKEGNYKEVQERFENRKQELYQQTFVSLCHELLKQNFQEDPIDEISTYWDNDTQMDIFARTSSKKTVVGSCKYTNSKLKKSELTALKDKSQKTGISPDIFVLMSKQGFSSELKSLKSDNLKLFTLKNFKKLLVNPTSI